MKKIKRFLGILLSLALVLLMMSGLGVTANAVDSPYAGLKNTTNVVRFDDKDWYLIDYDDSTVTLLAKECIGASKYSDNNYVEYDQSKVKEVVDQYYKNKFSAAAKTAINGKKMFLLTAEQARTIYTENPNVLMCSQASGAVSDLWWLCSQGVRDYWAAFVYCELGEVNTYGYYVSQTLGVRPALKLNLSSVTFSSNTFTVTGGTDPAADNDGSLIVESADGAPACEAGGLTSDDILAIATEEGFEGAGADDLALKLEVSNIDETVPAEEKAVAEDYVASLGENIHIGLYTDLSLFLVGGGNRLQVTDLGGRSLTVYMIAPDYLLAPAGFTRHFIVFQIHNGVPIEVGRSSTRRIPVTAGRFSTYVIAYYDVADGGSGSHEHDHHICEKGHKFAYCVMQAPTTEVDGFAEWRCTQCGIYDWNDHDNADAGETVTLSAYPVFNDTLENNIKAASAGDTVSIETKRWVSVRRGVLEALAEKPGVTLSIRFAKDGSDYVLTIPGGDPALAGILASEDRFFSFTTLGNTYGLTAVEK